MRVLPERRLFLMVLISNKDPQKTVTADSLELLLGVRGDPCLLVKERPTVLVISACWCGGLVVLGVSDLKMTSPEAATSVICGKRPSDSTDAGHLTRAEQAQFVGDTAITRSWEVASCQLADDSFEITVQVQREVVVNSSLC